MYLQTIVSIVALLGGLLAGYELLFLPDVWSKNAIGFVARGWVFVILTTIGVDELIFGQNAVLQVGYLLGLQLLPLQIGFVVSLVVAIYFWTGR